MATHPVKKSAAPAKAAKPKSAALRKPATARPSRATDTKKKARPKVDPVAVELVRNSLVAATEEMKSVLMRTSYNMIIYEALDFTVGLFDAQGQTMSIGLGLPMFIRGMSDVVKAKLEHWGEKDIHPGDILLTNDSYLTGAHLNHLTFSMPVFHKGKIVAFSTCMAHWQDIGGILNGFTTDIYSEGLQIPLVKYHVRGKLNTELRDLILMNVRRPDRAEGDLEAQLSACRMGVKHVEELMTRHGAETVTAAMDEIMNHSEAEARAKVRLIPDGVYEAESWMDDDAIDIGEPVPIRVKVTVKGDEMTVDLSSMSPQVKGFFNSCAGVACAQVAFKCLTLPRDNPINDGNFRPLKVIIPQGTVVSATRPAPMRVWMTYPMTVVDTIFKALAPAIPDLVIAGHHADLLTANVNGIHPADGKLFMYLGGLIGGGWGAKSDEDGVNVTVCMNDGDTHNGPSEQVENKFPLLVKHYTMRTDSGGAGQFRGGLGAETELLALSRVNFLTRSDRVVNTPWGLNGGQSAMGNQIGLRKKDGTRSFFPNGKVNLRLDTGESYILRSGGGGGFGEVKKRKRESVLRDLRLGYISRQAAERDYGIILSAAELAALPAQGAEG
ncbi:MAG: hydantoinase B/oxoprolinase family protein [Betaproteobacteria bacterium]|nr:hydantoinase B/oxoprolinase family protein [Betaproteobacteria bacterium]